MPRSSTKANPLRIYSKSQPSLEMPLNLILFALQNRAERHVSP